MGWAGRMNCLRASVPRCVGSPVRSASGASDSTADCANSSPITDAGSTAARSVRSSRSSRASSRAWMVGGTAMPAPSSASTQRPSTWRNVPASTSIDSICSAYSGLPSAARTTRPTSASGRPVAPSSCVTSRAAASSDSGLSAMRCVPGCVHHSGRASTRSWRAVASTSTGTSRACCCTCSSRSRKAGSAQWMSSTNTSSGASAAWCSTKRRAAQLISPSGNAGPPRPAALIRRSATSGSPIVSRSRASTASARSLSRMPAASRSIISSGQNVMPSP